MDMSKINSYSNVMTSMVSSQNSWAGLTNVTSSDPQTLASQAKQLTNKISDLKANNGSQQQIQKLQQSLQAVNNKIQQKQLEKDKSTLQPSPNYQTLNNLQTSGILAFTSEIDIKV